MSLISLHDITLSFGGPSVLQGISLRIEAGERLCLVGRNGEGKSTLLQLIAGDLQADSGNIIRRSGLRVALLGQEVPPDLSGTVFDVVAGGLGELFALLARHHAVATRLAETGGDKALLAELDEVQAGLEAGGGWQAQQRVAAVLSRLQLEDDRDFTVLSGGLKRRVLLARALVGAPDLLLLDEPTNHLDIDAITWLEEFLPTAAGALLFVTHDRMLLRQLATRILDLDRGRLTSWPGDYNTYLRRRDEMLAAETGHQAVFDKKLAAEEAWIRQGIKARRTRNEGRVRALREMREERRARRQAVGRVNMRIQETAASGRLVAAAKNVSFGYNDEIVIRDFSTTIMRGDKVGIIGPNGSGKTTLLRLLLGDLQPRQGVIRHGTNLTSAYFDQHRALLDEDDTVMANVGEGKEMLTINGRPQHVIGYLQNFLFAPDRARSPVRVLSGGERNRLLLARMFARPANILVLDEPTNDLDVETLELLEELLFEYRGTVLLISHDRAFLNNVVTSSLVFEGKGIVQEYAGAYDDWLRQRPAPVVARPAAAATAKKKKRIRPADGPRKLTFKEERELADLPQRIENMEAEQQELYDAMAAPAFYRQEGAVVSRAKARLAELDRLLVDAYERWEGLETVRENHLATGK